MYCGSGVHFHWSKVSRKPLTKVLGFTACQRRSFLDAVMRYGMPPQGSHKTQWLVRDLHNKEEKVYRAYVALFLRHLCEMVPEDAETYSDGVPCEGLSRKHVLTRIGIIALIRRKVQEFEAQNGTTNMLPFKKEQVGTVVISDAAENMIDLTKSETGSLEDTNSKEDTDTAGESDGQGETSQVKEDEEKKAAKQQKARDLRQLFYISDGGFTQLHVLWQYEEQQLKPGREYETWHRRHDYWLLAGVVTHGYRHWQDITHDPRFDIVNHAFPSNTEKFKKAAFFTRRFQLLEQGLVIEELLHKLLQGSPELQAELLKDLTQQPDKYTGIDQLAILLRYIARSGTRDPQLIKMLAELEILVGDIKQTTETLAPVTLARGPGVVMSSSQPQSVQRVQTVQDPVQHSVQRVQTVQHPDQRVQIVQHLIQRVQTDQHPDQRVQIVQHLIQRVQTDQQSIQHPVQRVQTVQQPFQGMHVVQRSLLHTNQRRQSVQQPIQGMQTVQHSIQGMQTVHHSIQGMQSVQQPIQGMQTVQHSIQGMQTVHHCIQGMQSVQQPIQGMQTVQHSIQGMQTAQHSIQGMQSVQQPIQGRQTVQQPIQEVQTVQHHIQGMQTVQHPVQHPVQGMQTVQHPIQGMQTVQHPIQGIQTVQHPIQGMQTVQHPVQHPIQRVQTLQHPVQHPVHAVQSSHPVQPLVTSSLLSDDNIPELPGCTGKVQRKKKPKKDPNKPKRPTCAYFYYIAQQRQELEKQGMKVTSAALWTKEVSLKWRALSDDEKMSFHNLAKKDKDRYVEAMTLYTGKDVNLPKKPMSSYLLWLADFRAQNKMNFAEQKDLFRAAGENWRNLTDVEKKPYEIKAEAEKCKYEEAMRNYNAMEEAANYGAHDDDDDY